MTRAGIVATQLDGGEIEPGTDHAHDPGAERLHYRVHPQDDGGDWQGPSEAAWTTRILRGARPPRQPTGMPGGASVPHG
jgi:hypothetical protein